MRHVCSIKQTRQTPEDIGNWPKQQELSTAHSGPDATPPLGASLMSKIRRARSGFRPINASALSDARFHEEVKAGAVLCARSIKPFERSRSRLRRTRPLCKFN